MLPINKKTHLPLLSVDLERINKNKYIFELKFLCYISVKVENL